MTIIQKLLAIKKMICCYEEKYYRQKNSVQLLAACKGQPLGNIHEVLLAGQKILGQNYLSEALPLMQSLVNENIEWHFIGPIQSNKTRKIAENFAWVHSIDNTKIAKRLNDQRPTDLNPLNICIEVNISHEPNKSGIHPEQVELLAKFCLTQPNLRLRGLMAIPAFSTDFQCQRQEFYKLASLKRQLEKEEGIYLDTLSMGMSNDFEAAIAEGATLVRLGKAIFESIKNYDIA